MSILGRDIRVALKAASPEEMSKLAKNCRESADTLRESEKLLVEAAKAFETGDYGAGYSYLKHADDRLVRK